MKKTLGKQIALASALTVASMGSQAAITQLIVNGGFETGDYSGWDQLPGAGTQTLTLVNPSSGILAANIENNTPSASLLRQLNLGAGLLTAGQAVNISFDYRGAAANGGVLFAELFSEVDGGGVSQSELLSGGPILPNADSSIWSTFNIATTVGPDVSGGITLQLNVACGAVAGCVSGYYLDNISVTADIAVAPVPVPAAAWLLGSALLGLGGISRRK